MAPTNISVLPSTDKAGWPWDTETDPAVYDPKVVWPKISIVTPSYNQAQFIEQTIRSVLLQNYPNLEYVIIDGDSTDNTVEIIRKYHPWITYWISEKDNGQSHAINKGIVKCSGEIFNWLNSDDWYEKGALHRIATAFMNQACDVVCAREKWVFHGSHNEIKRRGSTLRTTLFHSIYEGHIDQPSTFWKFSVLKQLLPVNEGLHYLMDADLWVRYLLKFGHSNVYSLSEIVVNFRFHENSKSTTLKENFVQERWAIRYGLLHAANPEERLLKWISLLASSDIPVYKQCEPYYEDFRRLAASDLIKKFYEVHNYFIFKTLYRYVLFNIRGSRVVLFKYLFRFLLPVFVVKFLRRLKN